MARYYVQSGTMRKVVEAKSTRRAALWAVHEAMRQVLPIDDGAEVSPEMKRDRMNSMGFVVLADSIRVSEYGFDRQDAAEQTTIDVVSQWQQMVAALDRLERNLYGAA